jgi:DNA-binding SARP family transcriptional activator
MAEIGHRVLGALGPLLPAQITRPAQRRLLCVLLLHRGTDLDRGYLFECMWGNQLPRSARNALHVHISGLRSAIADDIIATTAHGYRIDPDDEMFDVSVFERLTSSAHGEPDPSERLRCTTTALELWRGRPYQELTDDTFAVPEVARLEECRLGLLELRMRALLALGQDEEVIPRLRELVERFPLRERLHADLMLALYRSGRQTEALRQYQSARQVLGEQVGIEPGPALRNLETRILLHDPDLGLTDLPLTQHNLPSSTASLGGRDKDLVATAQAPSSSRLAVAVCGPEVGESRLAVELENTALGHHAGRVSFAAFSGTSTGEVVAESFRAAVHRSLSNLASEDRELLDDVAVFNGWFGLADIEAVCAGGRDRMSLITALVRIVDVSLLLATRNEDGSMRYRMLVPTREILIASRRQAHGDGAESYVRHYLSRALTRGHDRLAQSLDSRLSTARPADPDVPRDPLVVPGSSSAAGVEP